MEEMYYKKVKVPYYITTEQYQKAIEIEVISCKPLGDVPFMDAEARMELDEMMAKENAAKVIGQLKALEDAGLLKTAMVKDNTSSPAKEESRHEHVETPASTAQDLGFPPRDDLPSEKQYNYLNFLTKSYGNERMDFEQKKGWRMDKKYNKQEMKELLDYLTSVKDQKGG